LIKIVENIFYSKIQYHKLLKTPFDAGFFALSDETTFQLLYHVDSTNLPYLRGSLFPKMVYSTKTKISDDKILLIPWKDSPPRSNMHGRKRPFTEKNGDIRSSYTGSVHGHRIRGETVKNGFRIRRSYKNTE
jgi:hypothetical protein